MRPLLDRNRPLSLVLGGGGVRGLAHVGALEAILAEGFLVTEIVGTSVGALVASFYGAVGYDLEELRRVGLGLTTRHLLAWSWLRRAPAPVYRRFRHRAGPIADAIDKLADATWTRTHHGVERLGLVTYDRIRSEVLVGHPGQSLLSVEDATRGAAALPGLFPARRVLAGSRELRLCDGGVANLLPVDVLLEPPFRPEQVLVVDISNTPRTRERHIEKVFAARRERPDLPIVLAAPETIGRPTVVYRSSRLASLVEEGRRSVAIALAQPAVAGAGVSPGPLAGT